MHARLRWPLHSGIARCRQEPVVHQSLAFEDVTVALLKTDKTRHLRTLTLPHHNYHYAHVLLIKHMYIRFIQVCSAFILFYRLLLLLFTHPTKVNSFHMNAQTISTTVLTKPLYTAMRAYS